MRMCPYMRVHAYTSCNDTGRWKFPIRKLNDLVALPKRPAAGRQRGQHRSRRTGPPPTGRAQSRPVGGGRQAQDQREQRKKTMSCRILVSPMKIKLMLLIPCSKLFFIQKIVFVFILFIFLIFRDLFFLKISDFCLNFYFDCLLHFFRFVRSIFSFVF